MGLFNRLITNLGCSNCTKEFQTAIQYKFGDTRQYSTTLGENIRWGGNDIGEPGNEVVMVYGIAEDYVCPFCGFHNEEEFDILVENNVITKVSQIENSEMYNHSNDCSWSVVH